MQKGSPQARIAPLTFCVGLTALIACQCDARPAISDPVMTIGNDGCHFRGEIRQLIASLPQHSDMREHAEKRAVRFAFENLHGVGVVENWDAEWSEVRLYFREDLPALNKALGRIGLQVDGRGHVVVPATLADEMALNIEANPNDGRYFAEARSYLACGSA